LGVTYSEIKLSFDPTMLEGSEDLAEHLYNAVEVAVEQGYLGFILLLDEAQVVRDERARTGERPLSLFDAQLVTSAGSTASGPSSRWTGTSDASRRSLFKRCELESQSQYIVVAVEIYGGRHDEAVGGDRR
jgi:hypothetical protein